MNNELAEKGSRAIAVLALAEQFAIHHQASPLEALNRARQYIDFMLETEEVALAARYDAARLKDHLARGPIALTNKALPADGVAPQKPAPDAGKIYTIDPYDSSMF